MAETVLEINGNKLQETLATDKWFDLKKEEAVQDQWVMMAMSYKKSADLLVDGLPKALLIGAEQQYIACPIMFLYRHFLEISLKGLMVGLQKLGKHVKPYIIVDSQVLDKRLPGHSLVQTWLSVKQLLIELSTDESKYNAKSEEPKTTYKAIEDRIREFDEIDKGSSSYRYSIDTQNNPALGPLPDARELHKVKEVVDGIEYYFGGFRAWAHDYGTAMTEAQYT